MLSRVIEWAAVASLVFSSCSESSYDADLAASYARLFQPVSGAKAGQALHLMKPEVFVTKITKGERLVTLDIRTPGEVAVFGSALPGSLAIPINELFTPDNLARVPSDTPVVVLCKSGTRATAAGIALRHIGFDNVFILKGGFKALSGYLDAKTANSPPAADKAK
jgi:rhodanese-related sulfurtransferase